METSVCNNLGSILYDVSNRFPDQCAIKAGREQYSFGQVYESVDRFSNLLRSRGIGMGSRVAILLFNCPAFSISYFATLSSGAVVVPINPLLTNREVKCLLDDCRPDLIIVEAESNRFIENSQTANGVPLMTIAKDPMSQERSSAGDSKTENRSTTEPVKIEQDETAVILYTSGTTGDPKGVELSHRNLYLNAKSVSEEKFSCPQQTNVLGPGDVGLASLPLSHAFGQTNIQNGVWFNGGCIVYQDRFNVEETIDLMLEQKVTFFAGVPTMFIDLINAGSQRSLDDLALKYAVCGGAAVSSKTKNRFRQLFDCHIQESYGLSETSPMISCQKIDEAQRAGYVGRPIYGVEIQVVDEDDRNAPPGTCGEIQVRGHNVFRGYFGNESATRESLKDGWFLTGDIGRIDESGELQIVDRKKEVIKSGGYTVYPREIENVLMGIKGIEQAVVLGVPDSRLGETVKAYVALTPEHTFDESVNNSLSNVDSILAEIRSSCKKNLASYKRPTFVEIVDEFPKGSTGKIDRKKLRTMTMTNP